MAKGCKRVSVRDMKTQSPKNFKVAQPWIVKVRPQQQKRLTAHAALFFVCFHYLCFILGPHFPASLIALVSQICIIVVHLFIA